MLFEILIGHASIRVWQINSFSYEIKEMVLGCLSLRGYNKLIYVAIV